MSLLLDARKKLQQAQAASPSHSELELSLEPHGSSRPATPTAASSDTLFSDTTPPVHRARLTGQNLFSAKLRTPPFARIGKPGNLLIALCILILLSTAGASYVWYSVTALQPLHPANTSLATPVLSTTTPHNNLVPGVVSSQVALPKPPSVAQPALNKWTTTRAPSHQTHKNNQSHKSKAMLVEQRPDQQIDPILGSAYLAYRDGKFEQAQLLYQQVLRLDERNTDALLGMAAIAQRHGSNKFAAHYYAQVLALDPRNAVANAGMSALTTDDNIESRLKTLLDEQPDSSSLHFALGNYYARQSRWGEAQQAYFNAYKLEPDNTELAFNLAVNLDRLGQKKSAVQYYQRALQLDPGHHADFDNAKISKRIEELTH